MILQTEADAQSFVRELCSDDAFENLRMFIAKLSTANDSQNLIARATLGIVWRRHVADSAQLLRYVSRETLPLLDLGSGAGFPGVVLAIMRPQLPVVLVESRKLRIQWLSEIIELTSARNCTLEGCDVRKVTSRDAQTITGRAFAPLARTISLAARFSTSETDWVLPKGKTARQEVTELPEPLRAMFHVEQSLTDPDAGILVGTGKVEIPK